MDQHADGHKVFSTVCFNSVWDLLDQSGRTHEQTSLMVDAAHASRYHWRMRKDAQPRNLAISCWQLARVYTAVGQPEAAAVYGSESLDLCNANDLGPFLTGYAREALARAAVLAGDPDGAHIHLAAATDAVAEVEDPAESAMLLDDIATIVDEAGRL